MEKTSLAFALVALCSLLQEAEMHVRKLGLPCPSPLERTNLTGINISGGKERLLASIETTNYAFGFTEQGFVHYIKKLNSPADGGNIRQAFKDLAMLPNSMSPDDARQLAARWLASIDINVEELDQHFRCKIDYPSLDKPVATVDERGKRTVTRMVPYFTVTWNHPEDGSATVRIPYVVKVELIGPTHELVSLSIDRSMFKRPPIEVPGALVLSKLPDESFINLWTNRALSVSNVYEILHTSTAYQSAALDRMLAVGNELLRQLDADTEETLSLKDLTDSFVAPPQFGFRAFLNGKHSAFEFDENGKLRYLFHVLPSGTSARSGTREFYEEMSRRPTLVNSNNVVTFAENWIGSIGIDVPRLNKQFQPTIDRYFFQGNDRKRHASYLWWVIWTQGATNSAVSVQIDGVTKRPERIHISEPIYWNRPGIGITNAYQLMQIPDAKPQRNPLAAHLNVLDREAK